MSARSKQKIKNLNKEKMKNPLYVVSENGSIVEEATNFFDAFFKRYGLGPFVDVINQFLGIFLDMVSSYPTLVALNKFLDDLIRKLESFAKGVYPGFFLYRT